MRINISAAEWRIMQVLWDGGGSMTSAEIVSKLDGDRSPRTFKTHLQRLVSKGFVTYKVDETDSRVYHYYPMAGEDECIRKENDDFVSRYYHGDVRGMLARFIGDSRLTEEQIDELSALLEAKKDDAP